MKNPALCLLLLFLASLALPLRAETDLTPVRRWIETSAGLKSISVDFLQERRLKTLNKPLVSTGRFWFKAPGSFRWQSGDPPKMIAIQKEKGKDLVILKPVEKEAQVLTQADLKEKAGSISTALEAGFPTSMEQFQKNFSIGGMSVRDGQDRISANLKDSNLSLVLLRIVFCVDQTTHLLKKLEVEFRDGSAIDITFTKIETNPDVAASLFSESLEGYTMEKKG